jgi:hypothetical protein
MHSPPFPQQSLQAVSIFVMASFFPITDGKQAAAHPARKKRRAAEAALPVGYPIV